MVNLKKAGLASCALMMFILLLSLLFENRESSDSHSYFKADINLKTSIKAGDLVLRQGLGPDSLLIRQISDSEFSHIGIVTSVKADKILITHATTDDDAEHQDMVITSSLDDYLSEERAKKFALLRLNFLKEKEIDEIIGSVLKHKGEGFNLAPFNDDNSPMYCTLLIYNAIREHHKDFALKMERVNVPLLEGDYLFPQAFLDSEKTAIILISE